MHIPSLSSLDYLVVIAFILSLLLVTYFSSSHNKEQDSDNYFLMARRLTMPMFIATLVSTWYGGIFGVTQITYQNGVYAFFTQGIFWYITYILFAIIIVPKIFKERDKVYTLPDLVGKLVGPKSLKITAFFNFIDVIPISSILALGILIQSFSDLSLLSSMIIGSIFVSLYTLWGGFKSIVYTDCLQFIAMFVGVILVATVSIISIGDLHEMWEKLPASHKTPLNNDSYSSFAVWGFIALASLIDPNFYQRCFAAKNKKTAQIGILLSTLFWIVFDLSTTIGALYARAYMPHLEASNAYLIYSLNVLPDGLKGILVISIASTIMSTLDSNLFTASKIGSRNIWGNSQENKTIIRHRICIIVVSFLSILIALNFSGNFKQIWKFFGSLNGGCLLIPILVAMLSKKKISDNVFIFSVSLSAIFAISWEFNLKTSFSSQIETFYIAVFTNMTLLLGYNLINTTRKKH